MPCPREGGFDIDTFEISHRAGLGSLDIIMPKLALSKANRHAVRRFIQRQTTCPFSANPHIPLPTLLGRDPATGQGQPPQRPGDHPHKPRRFSLSAHSLGKYGGVDIIRRAVTHKRLEFGENLLHAAGHVAFHIQRQDRIVYAQTQQEPAVQFRFGKRYTNAFAVVGGNGPTLFFA